MTISRTAKAQMLTAAVLLGVLTACGGTSTAAPPDQPQDDVSAPTTQAPEPAVDPMLAVKTECLAVANDVIALLEDTQTYSQVTAIAAIETFDAGAIDAAADSGEDLKSQWDAASLESTACDPISPSFSQAVSEYSNAADDMVSALHMTADGIRTMSTATLESSMGLLEEALGHMQNGTTLIETALTEVQSYS